jgi:hypothetical protein
MYSQGVTKRKINPPCVTSGPEVPRSLPEPHASDRGRPSAVWAHSHRDTTTRAHNTASVGVSPPPRDFCFGRLIVGSLFPNVKNVKNEKGEGEVCVFSPPKRMTS